MRKPEAVGNGAHLHRHRMTAEAALPRRPARRPRRHQMVRIARRAVGADKSHRDAVGFARDIERDFVALQPYRAAALALHQPAVHLTGYLPLALAEHMIDGSRNRRQPAGDLAFRRTNRKPAGKFLRYEAGGKISLSPARLMHQRGEERDVVTDAIDVE